MARVCGLRAGVAEGEGLCRAVVPPQRAFG